MMNKATKKTAVKTAKAPAPVQEVKPVAVKKADHTPVRITDTSLRDAHQFEFGSSRSCREKDALIAGR